jgi:NADH-quinone oxidoreductase subunit G
MVIQVADEAGIYIPRFCYHKHLTVAANCRMCLVEVEKSPKALPACATPVAPGMKIFTRSSKALAAQKAVMEFLLINHPLDCPICDQGGECELQDLSMGYGSPDSYYNQTKRVVKDQDIGPLVATDMTRCIQCTRCVRFGDEIAGLRELGAVNRGEHMEISTYVSHALHSEVSGNIIDLCPVGALTSKPFRFSARAWELEQYPAIAAHDCVGANIYVHTRRGTVMRVVPHENKSINETWISDRDRYSYEGLYHPDRITQPLYREGETWHVTTWEKALDIAARGLQSVGSNIGALISPNATTEECFLLQKIMRNLGSENIDYRLRQADFGGENVLCASANFFNELENAEHIVLIGSNITKEQPNIGLRIRKATKKGAKVTAINMMDYHFHFPVTDKKMVAPHLLLDALKTLETSENTHTLLGAGALNHPFASLIKASVAKLPGKVTYLTEGANANGALLAGAHPGEKGLNARTMLQEKCDAYVLLNVEPDLDCGNPAAAIEALQAAKFVVSLSIFKNPVLEQYANVILPITPFTESGGTFINVAGEKQSFRGVAKPYGESRPGWKVLRVLGNFLELDGFDFESVEEVFLTHSREGRNPFRIDSRLQGDAKALTDTHLSRIGDIPMYSIDSLVRRSEPLQATQKIIDGDIATARLNPETAKEFHLHEADMIIVKQGESKIGLTVAFDDRVPVSAIYIPGGIPETSGLSELFGAVEVIKM